MKHFNPKCGDWPAIQKIFLILFILFFFCQDDTPIHLSGARKYQIRPTVMGVFTVCGRPISRKKSSSWKKKLRRFLPQQRGFSFSCPRLKSQFMFSGTLKSVIISDEAAVLVQNESARNKPTVSFF